MNGIGNVEPLISEIKKGRIDIHYIEVMACEGGCVGGGGQPIHPENNNIKARAKSTCFLISLSESVYIINAFLSL